MYITKRKSDKTLRTNNIDTILLKCLLFLNRVFSCNPVTCKQSNELLLYLFTESIHTVSTGFKHFLQHYSFFHSYFFVDLVLEVETEPLFQA